MRCREFSGVKQYNYYANYTTALYGRYEGIERYMLECHCYHCKNRAIGCHKFCDNYRAYRRQLEAIQAEQKKEKESSIACIETYYRNNFRRKAKK